MSIDQSVKDKLVEILERVAESQNIQNYEVAPEINETKGEGFLSEFFTGSILNKDNGDKLSVAIKKAPLNMFWDKFKIAHGNEIYFYETVFPMLDTFQRKKGVKEPFDKIPKYFTGSVASGNEFVAMVDLKRSGYALHDKKKHLTSEQIEFLFKIYGKLHALSFAFQKEQPEEFEKFKSNGPYLMTAIAENDNFLRQTQDSYLAALSTFDPITEADNLKRLKKIENVKEVFSKTLNYKGNYNCLIHGDCWSNNMLFKYSEVSGKLEDIKLLDFQIIAVSTPVHDLSYFFYSGAAKEDLDKLNYYLDVYYKSLSDFYEELGGNPEDLIPLEDLKNEWKQYCLFGLYFGIQVWAVKLIDKNKILELIEQRNLPMEKYLEVASGMKKEVYKGELFKERAKNLCLHALEFGIL